MPDSILDMRFNQNPDDILDDEPFLQATYQAGIQVEKKKALKAAKEAMRGTGPTHKEKDGQGRRNPDQARKGKETEKEPRAQGKTGNTGKDRPDRTGNPYGKKDTWKSREDALKGVPSGEKEEYGKSWDNCWRCGREGHKTYECYAFTTAKGTSLPPAPWKVAAVAPGKRKRSEEPEETPMTKNQKVAAVEEMDTNVPMWESDSDF